MSMSGERARRRRTGRTTTRTQTGEMTKLCGYIKRSIRCSCQRFQLFVSSHHHDLVTHVSTRDMSNTAEYLVVTTTSFGYNEKRGTVTIGGSGLLSTRGRNNGKAIAATPWRRGCRAFPLLACFPVLVVAAAVVDRLISGLVPRGH